MQHAYKFLEVLVQPLHGYISFSSILPVQKGKKKEQAITKIAMFGVWAIPENAKPDIELSMLSIEATQSS